MFFYSNILFFLEDYNVAYVNGAISTKISIECQRCLKYFFLDLDISFNLAFVKKNNININPEFEMYFLIKDEISIFDLISEEILLAIPISPSHEYNCQNNQMLISKEKMINKNKPFEILKTLNLKEEKK